MFEQSELDTSNYSIPLTF